MSSDDTTVQGCAQSFSIDGQTLLLIAPIGECAALELRADSRDLRSVEGISSQKRRAERLAWRALLRESIGEDVEIEYEESGAPIVKNSPYKHISVSHCRDRVAVLLSLWPCGVDIECRDRDFCRVAERYLSAEELKLSLSGALPREEFLQLAWSAKEALYKLHRSSGLDLRGDICVEHIDSLESAITLRFIQKRLLAGYHLNAEHTLVWCVDKKESPDRE